MSSSCRDRLRNIHSSPRVNKSTPIHHRHTETHCCIQSHEDVATQPHERQQRYQRSCPPPSPRNSNALVGTRRPTTINSIDPRNHSTTVEKRVEQLPSLFARLKANLASRRPIISTTSTSPLSPPIRPVDYHCHSSEQMDEDYYPFNLSSSPSPPLCRHQPTDGHVGEPSPSDLNPHHPVGDDGPCPLADRQSQPCLFGIPCSAAGQKAYSNHNEDTERCLLGLQHKDTGRVEHRTTAFATHLSISRWEPVSSSTAPSGNTVTISSIDELRANCDRSGFHEDNNTSGGDHINSLNSSSYLRGQDISSTSASWSLRPTLTKQPQHQHRNSPLYAARLISLANYIRHIVSLSSGNTPSTLAQQQQQEQQRQQKVHGHRSILSYPSEGVFNTAAVDNYGNSPLREHQDSTSSPSSLLAGPGPGPIRAKVSLTSRKHHHAPEHHDHQTRRQVYHHPQQQRHSYHRLSSSTSPTVYPRHRHHRQQQQLFQGMGAAQSPVSNSSTMPVSPYLRIPYPNLTMTLALIYMDRLKAKYPEEKGEPGCSHRLFLVAYVVAAKYRCCVELAALLQEHEDHVIEMENRRSRNDLVHKHEHRSQGSESYYHSSDHSNHDLPDSAHEELIERVFEAQARAELILSNHEWVRLLCLGSFTRSPPPSRPSDSAQASGTVAARTDPPQPMTLPGSPPSSLVSLKPEPLPIHSSSPCDTVKGSAHNAYHSTLAAPGQVKPALSSPSTPQAPSAAFQVEDLDRMETEFLTLLDFNLSTRGQDLNTCWSLLVGNTDA
ncbi:hypothetical protein B0O80DRAFT_491957 [Mortierella sp. GBAus27b]|nr:hypothetical protein B0O80DRAFT_491957 [Mortierella sp. GBAus27b]